MPTTLPRGAGRACATAMVFSAALGAAHAATPFFEIVDDPALTTAVTEARAELFRSRKPDARLHACLLVKETDSRWRRGGYEETVTSYPASTVKLCYLAAAMHYAKENGKAPDWLDASVRPMIHVSSNPATGEVVDAITGAPNTTTGDLEQWIEKRRYTAKFLDSRGLLGNQNIINKTYPSNSGDEPKDYEGEAFKRFGSNKLQPGLMAELMLEIVKGKMAPEAQDYMMGLLTHERFSIQTPFGTGVPPGSVYINKGGWTSTSLSDIAYVKLPNGREFILVAYSNLYSGADPEPYMNAPLGVFMDLVIAKAGLDAGDPPTLRLDNRDPQYMSTGTWQTETKDTDKHGEDYVQAMAGVAGKAGWKFDPPAEGRYEVSLWWPDGETRCAQAVVAVKSADGLETKTLDQRKCGGVWVRVGEFKLPATGAAVYLDAGESKGLGTVAVDALRVQKVP